MTALFSKNNKKVDFLLQLTQRSIINVIRLLDLQHESLSLFVSLDACVCACPFIFQYNLRSPLLHLRRAIMSLVSFHIWGNLVIWLHNQPAVEVRFHCLTVTSRCFTLENKESGKRDCDRSSMACWNKSPTWMIYLFPLFEAEKRSLPAASVWAVLPEYLGRAAACKTVGYEAHVPTFSLHRDTVHTKGKECTAALARGYLV